MPELLRMPEVATGSTSAVLSAWNVGVDQQYASGDVIAVIETDKAVVDMEAETDGRIVHFIASDGQEVATGDPIAVWASAGEEVSDPVAAAAALGVDAEAAGASGEPAAPSPAPSTETEPAPVEPGSASSTASVTTGRIFASPLARRLAREAGLALEIIVGTGPNGRIRRRDVEAAKSAQSAIAPEPTTSASSAGPAGSREVPHTRLRKAIANRLTESKTTIPHFYVRGTAIVDELLNMRAQMNEGEDVRVSVNDFLLKTVAYAHTKVPEMNVVWTPDSTLHFDSVDIAVAIATDSGLVTPVLRDVANMPLGRIAESTKDFAQRAASNGLRQNELEGGSVSVSNLGMFGTEGFDAIINPPQSSILAVGAAKQSPVVRDRAIEIATTLQVSLSVDHRPIDGATAARWMQVFIEALENPARIVR